MKEQQLLIAKLKPLFAWNQARLAFFAQFILALLQAQTTNLTKIAQKFRGKAQLDSHYKRIQRFLRFFALDFSTFAVVITKLLPLEPKWMLCLDRTQWKFGKLDINLLVLGVAYQGVCIPLFWSFLPKKGLSHTQERIQLLDQFLETFSCDKISYLLADREFIGKDWISALLERNVSFRIRIPKNIRITNVRSQKEFSAQEAFRTCRMQEIMVLRGKRQIWGLSLYLVGLRREEDSVILITDRCPKTAMQDYKRRWEIETLFGCLKSRGFDFEQTHLCQEDRVCKLLALMTFGFCWCLLQGESLSKIKKIPLKKHGRLAKSIFRTGLESLSHLLSNSSLKRKHYLKALSFLSCT